MLDFISAHLLSFFTSYYAMLFSVILFYFYLMVRFYLLSKSTFSAVFTLVSLYIHIQKFFFAPSLHFFFSPLIRFVFAKTSLNVWLCVCVSIFFRHMKDGYWLQRRRWIILKLASYHIRRMRMSGLRNLPNDHNRMK